MQRVIDEMAKAKGDIEKRYREKIPEIIRECMAFAYLGKSFTFDANAELDRKVNRKLIALSDEIMEDIEARAKRCIAYAEDEEDEDVILAYMKREQNGEDLLSRIDKHNSNFRYFLEGWMAIGMVNGLSQGSLLTNIMTYMANPYISPLWQDTFKEGYLSNSIRTRGYSFGKGNMRNPIDALTILEQDSINSAFQYGRVLRYAKDGAIGYRTHRASSYPCDYCDELTLQVWPLDVIVLPAHPRCVCYSSPVYPSIPPISTTPEAKVGKHSSARLPQKTLKEVREEKYKALLADPNYKDVEFDKSTGGLRATHIHHNLDKNKGIYEIEVQEAGFKAGHSVILESERNRGVGEKFTEGLWDDLLFEIAARETATANNVLRGLKHCAEKRETEIAVLYFPFGGFDEEILERAIKRYRGLEKLNDEQYIPFKKIICVQNKEIIYNKPF